MYNYIRNCVSDRAQNTLWNTYFTFGHIRRYFINFIKTQYNMNLTWTLILTINQVAAHKIEPLALWGQCECVTSTHRHKHAPWTLGSLHCVVTVVTDTGRNKLLSHLKSQILTHMEKGNSVMDIWRQPHWCVCVCVLCSQQLCGSLGLNGSILAS